MRTFFQATPDPSAAGWKIVHSSLYLGPSPIGPRLFKNGVPDLPKTAPTKRAAEELAREWTRRHEAEWGAEKKRKKKGA